MLIADKAYAYDRSLRGLRTRGIAHTTAARADRIAPPATPNERPVTAPPIDR